MKNEPEKWTEQRWVLPSRSLWFVRKEKDWYLTDQYETFKLPVNDDIAGKLLVIWASIHEEEDWIYRHSLQFRWLRFWYRRRKKREAKNDKGNGTTNY